MGSVQARYKGDRTYEAVETIAGGQLVEARTNAGRSLPGAGVAGAASVKVLGVAQKDAVAVGAEIRTPVSGVLDQTLAPPEFEVINAQFVPGVKYSTAAAYGARLVAAALGCVRPYVPGTDDAGLIVGWCAEKDGVLLNATGLTWING